MSVVTMRRGLPRVAGGAPWPPADAAPPAPEVMEAAPAPAAAVSEAAAAPAAPSGPAAAAPAVPLSAGTAAGAGLRRGLPRVVGGDPWPPEGVAPVAPAPVPRPQETPRVPEPVASQEVASEPPVETAAAAPSAAAAAGEAVPVRRGLPRAAGGDPWPPDGFVAVRDTEPSLLEASAVVPAVPEIAPPVDRDSADAVPVVRAPRPVLSPIARAVRDHAGAPGSPAEPQPRPWYKPHWHQAIAGLIGAAGVLLLAVIGVFTVRGLLSTSVMQDFLVRYPGEYHLPEATDEGFPAWARWSHFLNMFFIVLIIRSGLQVRHQKKPPAYWASKRGSKISINLWLHQSLDILWILNGVVFVVLLFATGHWARIVPTSWEVFPNALSAALQYVSLDWPTENGWINYNSLQQLAYFSVVFLAAPLAVITGVRMSGVWPKNAKALSKAYPIELARAIHFPTMLFFVVFVIFHVGLVFATGALRNLNHMYAGQDVVNWAGFGIFALSIAAVVAAWIAARPLVLAPIASLFGRVSER